MSTATNLAEHAARLEIPTTLECSLVEGILEQQRLATSVTFPSTRWQNDPIGFAREVLGVQNVWSKQVEMLAAILEHERVAIRAGRKVSKSFTMAITALWWFCSFPKARVIITAPTAPQVDQIIFRDIRDLWRASQLGPYPIDGELFQLARTGLRSEDGSREVIGRTATDPINFQGYSGSRLLFLVDEASGVEAEIVEVIKGNLGGGGRLILTGNPTRTSGEFYDAFHSKSSLYKCVHVSSEDSPNVIAGKEIIPGLATRSFIEETMLEYGDRDHPFFKIHVLGDFVLDDDTKCISIDLITRSVAKWHLNAPPSGRLHVACDPAGEAGFGDESVFAVRRGYRIVDLFSRRGLSPEEHVQELEALVKEHRRPDEEPVIAIDAEGAVGARVNEACCAWEYRVRDLAGLSIRLLAVRGSNQARKAREYDRVRDELYGDLKSWLRAGGEIPPDRRLHAELHAFDFHIVERDKRPLLKVTPKDKIRTELKRSPDRADAVTLAVRSLPGEE